MYNRNLVKSLTELVRKFDIPPRLLQLEVTERAYMENPEVMERIVSELQREGFIILMDDFGSGYSSLNMLSSIDFDEIKLDKGFLKESPLSVKSQKLIRLILQFISGQSIHTVAEGVETKEQLTFLRENGCDTAQGYFFSRPVSGEAYDRLLLQQKG